MAALVVLVCQQLDFLPAIVVLGCAKTNGRFWIKPNGGAARLGSFENGR
jgi:hypothetical protein